MREGLAQRWTLYIHSSSKRCHHVSCSLTQSCSGLVTPNHCLTNNKGISQGLLGVRTTVFEWTLLTCCTIGFYSHETRLQNRPLFNAHRRPSVLGLTSPGRHLAPGNSLTAKRASPLGHMADVVGPLRSQLAPYHRECSRCGRCEVGLQHDLPKWDRVRPNSVGGLEIYIAPG